LLLVQTLSVRPPRGRTDEKERSDVEDYRATYIRA